MEHKGTVYLETERLILRAFTNEDLNAMYTNWCSDERVTKYLRWPAHNDISITEMVLEDWVNSYSDERFYQWAIVPKGATEPIGTISVVEQNELAEKMQIGFCVGYDWWNKGYTSEAFRRVIQFLFEEVKAQRIEAMHAPENPNSGKVMLSCGLQHEGTLRKADWNNQGIADACMYAILKEDYE